MNLYLTYFKKLLTPIEIVIFLAFLAFLLMPTSIPTCISLWINSSIGLGLVVIITTYMFFYYSPILGIFTIVVAYELLRRASIPQYNNYAVQLDTKPIEETVANTISTVVSDSYVPFSDKSLEEEVISKDAPVGQSAVLNFVDTTVSFVPIAAKNINGSSAI